MEEKIIEEVKLLVKNIKNSSSYREYLELKKKLLEDKNIMSLINQIKLYQRKIVRGEITKDEGEKKIEFLEKKLDKSELYEKYLMKERKLNNTFQAIKISMENYLDKLIK